MELTAFDLMGGRGESLVEPAPFQRAWMEAMPSRAAYRCLPLLIANQAGWFVRLPTRVEAIWNGGDNVRDCEVTTENLGAPITAKSHFGYGIITWVVPYLFRTPPGYNLLARGPSNWPKDRQARSRVSCTWSSASWIEPSMR